MNYVQAIMKLPNPLRPEDWFHLCAIISIYVPLGPNAIRTGTLLPGKNAFKYENI